ncbi:MAG: DUF3332 family protein [Thermodesulfobacteriota bacterium]
MKKTIALILVAALLSGCMGTGAINAKAKELNLKVTENRWGREGTFLVFTVLWVYRVCAVLDLFIFNSIEFWSGKNFINGKNALVDLPMDQVQMIGLNDINNARIERIDENNAKLHVDFENGDKMTFDVIRDQDVYTVSYLGREFYRGELKKES